MFLEVHFQSQLSRKQTFQLKSELQTRTTEIVHCTGTEPLMPFVEVSCNGVKIACWF
jgi:hypothetical protein